VNNYPTPIFLLSLPRSGSTLCQRILSTSSEIVSTNEPHILIPLLFSIKDQGVLSTYSHVYTTWAIEDFCQDLPKGIDDYKAEIRQLTLNLYQKAMHHKARYFLDKTPKYHFIVEDLFEIFPDAKFVFLWRNPLEVIASMINTWGGGRWNLYYFYIDLFQGLDNLVNASKQHAENSICINFEDVVQKTEDTFEKVFQYLDLPYDPSQISKMANIKFNGRITDPNSRLEEYNAIVVSPLNKWKNIMNNPVRKAWSRRYLTWIGNERLQFMGYDLNLLYSELDALPTRYHQVFQDTYRILMGSAYHIFEFEMLKEKLKAKRQGQRIYIHA
jgi:hypothetical protein